MLWIILHLCNFGVAIVLLGGGTPPERVGIFWVSVLGLLLYLRASFRCSRELAAGPFNFFVHSVLLGGAATLCVLAIAEWLQITWRFPLVIAIWIALSLYYLRIGLTLAHQQVPAVGTNRFAQPNSGTNGYGSDTPLAASSISSAPDVPEYLRRQSADSAIEHVPFDDSQYVYQNIDGTPMIDPSSGFSGADMNGNAYGTTNHE